MELAINQLDQKSIEKILVKIRDKAQKNPSLSANDVVNEIVEQVKEVLECSIVNYRTRF